MGNTFSFVDGQKRPCSVLHGAADWHFFFFFFFLFAGGGGGGGGGGRWLEGLFVYLAFRAFLPCYLYIHANP